MNSLIVSCAAEDDDPLEQGLGVARVDEALCFGEMGGAQMHGLGRVQSSLMTYIGFFEHHLYHGPGLLIDHEERSRSEGVFTMGQLSEGKSTSPSIDREGRRSDDGLLEGRGIKVMRELDRVKVLRGSFTKDQLDGRASVWSIVDTPTEGLELEQRLEAIFHKGSPVFGRAYNFRDGLAYIGGLDHRERRKGIGFTLTKAGKVVVMEREGEQTIGEGLIADLSANTYRRTGHQGGGGGSASSSATSSPTCEDPSLQQQQQPLHHQQQQQQQQNEISFQPSTLMPHLPSFWDEAGILDLLRQALDDPATHWNALGLLAKALRGEQARLLREEVPSVAITSYSDDKDEVGPLPLTLYQGDRLDNMRHGHGVGLLLPTGDIYRGQWVRDMPEGQGTLVRIQEQDVFCGEIREGLNWVYGAWSLLSGWRVQGSFVEPEVPLGVVSVWSPLPERTKIEAYYRMKQAGLRRDDADIRITTGKEGAHTIFRGSVYPTDGILVIPKPRRGLEYRALEDATYELEYDPSGTTSSNKVLVVHNDKEGTIYRGQMVDGLPHSFGLEFHRSTKTLIEGQYTHGKLHGRAQRTCHTSDIVFLVEYDHGEEKKCISSGQKIDERLLRVIGDFNRIAQKSDKEWLIKLHQPFEVGIAGAETGDPAQMMTKAGIMLQQQQLEKQQQQQQHSPFQQHQALASSSSPSTPRGGGGGGSAVSTPTSAASPLQVRVKPSQQQAQALLPDLDKMTKLEGKNAAVSPMAVANNIRAAAALMSKKPVTPKRETTITKQQQQEEGQGAGRGGQGVTSSSSHPKQKQRKGAAASEGGGGVVRGKKSPSHEEEEVDKSAGDLMDHPQMKPQVMPPPLVIPEMRQRDREVEDLMESSPPEDFQLVKSKKVKVKTPNQAGTTTIWGGKGLPTHVKSDSGKKGPAPGVSPVEILCIVEAGWQAGHVRILVRREAEVNVLSYKVIVNRTERPTKDFKAVESTHNEFPVMGLTNDIKYNFTPSVRLEYQGHVWRVMGDMVRTSPPGPIKTKPRDLAQPFLRKMNDKGELMPNDEEGYWQWARYVSGHELSISLPPMKSFALKARVEEGNGALAVELELAKELHIHAEAMTVWIHPAQEPGLVSSGLRTIVPFMEGQPFRAEIKGLVNGKLYNVAFRLTFAEETYPCHEGIIILPGVPDAEALPLSSSSIAREGPMLVGREEALQQQHMYVHQKSPSVESISSGRSLSSDWKTPPTLPIGTDDADWPTLSGEPVAVKKIPNPEDRVASVSDVLPIQLPPPALSLHEVTATISARQPTPPPGLALSPVGGGPSPVQSPVPQRSSFSISQTSIFCTNLPTIETTAAAPNKGDTTVGYLPLIVEGHDADVDSLFKDMNSMMSMEQNSLAEAATESARKKDEEHVCLFLRQARADPEYTGPLVGAIPLGPSQQYQQEQQQTASKASPFDSDIISGTAAFRPMVASGAQETSSFFGFPLAAVASTATKVEGSSTATTAAAAASGTFGGLHLPTLETSKRVALPAASYPHHQVSSSSLFQTTTTTTTTVNGVVAESPVLEECKREGTPSSSSSSSSGATAAAGGGGTPQEGGTGTTKGGASSQLSAAATTPARSILRFPQMSEVLGVEATCTATTTSSASSSPSPEPYTYAASFSSAATQSRTTPSPPVERPILSLSPFARPVSPPPSSSSSAAYRNLSPTQQQQQGGGGGPIARLTRSPSIGGSSSQQAAAPSPVRSSGGGPITLPPMAPPPWPAYAPYPSYAGPAPPTGHLYAAQPARFAAPPAPMPPQMAASPAGGEHPTHIHPPSHPSHHATHATPQLYYFYGPPPPPPPSSHGPPPHPSHHHHHHNPNQGYHSGGNY